MAEFDINAFLRSRANLIAPTFSRPLTKRVTDPRIRLGTGETVRASSRAKAIQAVRNVGGAGIAGATISKAIRAPRPIRAPIQRAPKPVSVAIPKVDIRTAGVAASRTGVRKVPLPVIAGGAAIAARFGFGSAIRRIGSRLIGGRVGAAITGAAIAGPPAIRATGRAISRNRAPLAIGGGSIAAGSIVGSQFGGTQQGPFPVEVVGGWNTGTAQFYRLSNGSFAVEKKNGTIKTYRAYRPVCIPKKWNSSSMNRVARALKTQRKTATTVMRMTGGMPKR